MGNMNTPPSGVYGKYYVTRVDGRPLDESFEGFVLRLDQGGDPAHVAACRKAIWAYAMAIQRHLPELAMDIFKRWGPNQIEGWEHHYCTGWPATDDFLIEMTVAEALAGRGIWVLVDNDRAARDLEVAIRTRLFGVMGREQVGLAMHQLVDVQAAKPSLLRGLSTMRLERVGTILVANPRRNEIFRQEGDLRVILNKKLFMRALPPIRLVSVETMGD